MGEENCLISALVMLIIGTYMLYHMAKGQMYDRG